MWKRKIYSLATLLLLALCLTSCFESAAPLSEPEAAAGDESIKGVWHAVVGKNDVYLHVIPMKPPILKLIRITHVNVGGYYNLDEAEMFPTIVGDKKFMNIKFLMPKDPDDRRSELTPRYGFVKYELSKDGVLTVWDLDSEVWGKAIADKKIKGTAWETTWASNVRIDDTGKNILNFLLSKDTEKEFRVLGRFRRIKVTDTPRSLRTAPRHDTRPR